MILFKKPKNPLEGQISEEPETSCPRCKKPLISGILSDNLSVCYHCNYHFRINARRRLSIICDDDSFTEQNPNLTSTNVLEFPEYDKKLKAAQLDSAEKEAVVCGVCTICGHKTAIFVMEGAFMMGSMGQVVGEKITSLFEYATENSLPVVGFTVSGGARMQEGIISLMQMAKTSGAVKRHSDAKNLYVCVLTDPTTGGVTASFAMEGDISIAEPYALIGFAGPRVIEQTIRKKLPDNFQRAEFLLEKGFVDMICERKHLRERLGDILHLHERKPAGGVQ